AAAWSGPGRRSNSASWRISRITAGRSRFSAERMMNVAGILEVCHKDRQSAVSKLKAMRDLDEGWTGAAWIARGTRLACGSIAGRRGAAITGDENRAGAARIS